MEFFRIRKDIPFMRHALVLNVVSFVTFALAVFFLATKGLHKSIEFTGGTLIEVSYAQSADINRTRTAVETLGYLFYVGDKARTDLPYASDPGAGNDWFRLRHEAAMTPEAIVRLAEAAPAHLAASAGRARGPPRGGPSPRSGRPRRSGPAGRWTSRRRPRRTGPWRTSRGR